jgi:photosystem II stability/assembly factor-like uncharacterized protein
MKQLVIILFIFMNTTILAQPWMQSPYLEKSKSEANYFDIVDAFNLWWGDRPYAKGSGFMPHKRWEYMNLYRCYPDGNFPQPGSYYSAYKSILEDYEANKNIYEKTDLSNWTPLGLTSWVNGYSGYNPGNGRVNTVTVDPNNSQIVYIAAASGGVWKSVNGGLSWNTTYDNMPHLGVSAIAIHPDSSDIIFIGTGDRDGYDTQAIGIYKSYDAGNTWLPAGMNTPSWNSINKIIFNPQNSNTMFIATNLGVYRSYNGGHTWSQVYNQSRVTDMLYHPTDTMILYGSGSHFIRTTNGGNTFSQNTTLPHQNIRLEIAVTPANSNYVYVLATNTSYSYGGTYLSTNSGSTFTLQSNSPNYLGYSMDADDDSGQGWFDLAIAVSPNNANEVYIGGINVWKSTNAGVSYNITSHWVYNDPNFYTHADIHYLGFYGSRLYCGSDGGVFYTDDFANTWNDISEGLGITQFYRLASSPIDANFIVAGSQDNGSNRLQSGTWTHIFGADGMQPMTHQTDINTFYVSYQFGGLLKTTDNGMTVEAVSPNDSLWGAWVTPYDMHPSNSEVIYAAYNDIYKSTNGGYSWTKISNQLLGSQSFTRMKVSPANPNYIYASRGAYLYVTKNDGQQWNSQFSGFNGEIVGITPCYHNPEKLWIAISGSNGSRIFYSENAGNSFFDITANISLLGVRSIVHLKDNHDALFVGTENAVFFKDTTMSQWIPYVNGLPNVIISDMEINYTSHKLRAATYGRGIWETPIPNLQNIPENTHYNTLQVFPNPSNGIVHVNLDHIQNVTQMMVFDITGKKVMDVPFQMPQTSIDLSSLVSGVYFIKVITNKAQHIQRIILQN